MSPAPNQVITLEEMKAFRDHLQTAVGEMEAALDMYILNKGYADILLQSVHNTQGMVNAMMDLIEEEEKGDPLQ